MLRLALVAAPSSPGSCGDQRASEQGIIPGSTVTTTPKDKELNMTAGPRPIFTNVCTYKAIADQADREMAEGLEQNVRPNPQGREGAIKRFDPERTSFKQAMVSIVFTCIWLEATLHLLIVGRYGKERFEELDRNSYERKLEALRCGDEDLLRRAGRLRKSRRALVHEKAHLEFNDEGEFTSELMTAQEEAENARAVMEAVEHWFGVDG